MTLADINIGSLFVMNGLWYQKFDDGCAKVLDAESRHDVGTLIDVPDFAEIEFWAVA
jgi:hypothetical protein